MPKYAVGEQVVVNHSRLGQWVGVVTKVVLCDDEYEYTITNAPEIIPGFPCLAWESECMPYGTTN